MCSNWIFAVGNLSDKCKFLKKIRWCPVCARVEIALIHNNERSFFVNYITDSFKGGGREFGHVRADRSEPDPCLSPLPLYRLQHRLNYLENNCILSAEDRHKSILTLHCSFCRQPDLPACYRGSGFGIHQYLLHNVHLLSTDHSCIGMNQEH